mmetsp:Transcript_1707/g.3928  ORF Transcript_1707/g.3928 Transcript_1707/m.3928 type:complete len:717 (-) Transcript_1707:50-2200(-)
MFVIDHDRRKATDMERKRQPRPHEGRKEISGAPVLLRPQQLSLFEGRGGYRSSHAETKSSAADDTTRRRRIDFHDPLEVHKYTSRLSPSKRTVVKTSDGRNIHEFNDQAEANKISGISNFRRPLHLDFPEPQEEHRFVPRSSPRKQSPRKSSAAKILSSSPDKTKRIHAHPLLPSLSSVASTPDSPHKNSYSNKLPQIQDSPSTVTTSNESNTMIRTAKATALQCVDHASRRQAAAEATLASSSKICSSLKELWQDSEQALSLARKSRIEAENAERRAEGAAVKVKAAREVAVNDIERSKLELDEANAQADEAWDFLRRVKGMKNSHNVEDRRQKVLEAKDERIGEHLGTILEIPKVIHTSSETTGSGTIDVNSPPKRHKCDKPEVIHVRLSRTKPPDRVGGRFHKMWDDVSSMGLQSKIDATPQNSKKGSTFEPIKKFQGHSAPVTQILVINQNRFLSSSWDKTIRLWDIDGGECLRVFQGHGDWVHSLCMGSNGHFFSGSDDRTIKMWNLESADCVRTFRGHSSFVKSLALLNSNHFLSGSRDRTIKLWMVGLDDCLSTFEGHADIISSIVPFGRNRFVSGSHDKTMKFWDVSSRSCLRTMYGHTGSVKSLTRVGDSEHLVISGSDDRTIRLWDVSTGECLREFGSRAAIVFSVTFICEGFFISCGGGKIQLWHMPSGSCVQSYDTPRISLAVACVDDERFITGSDRMLHMWEF